jgi:hypothetical protein
MTCGALALLKQDGCSVFVTLLSPTEGLIRLKAPKAARATAYRDIERKRSSIGAATAGSGADQRVVEGAYGTRRAARVLMARAGRSEHALACPELASAMADLRPKHSSRARASASRTHGSGATGCEIELVERSSRPTAYHGLRSACGAWEQASGCARAGAAGVRPSARSESITAAQRKGAEPAAAADAGGRPSARTAPAAQRWLPALAPRTAPLTPQPRLLAALPLAARSSQSSNARLSLVQLGLSRRAAASPLRLLRLAQPARPARALSARTTSTSREPHSRLASRTPQLAQHEVCACHASRIFHQLILARRTARPSAASRRT